MQVFHGLALAAATAILTVGLAGPPALAAAPSNDAYGGAVVIPAVPFRTALDTSEATTDADDAELNVCGAPAMDASVWYRFTATADEAYTADASASGYSAGVFVATGAPGAFTVLACAPGGVAWQALAGETYSIIVIDDQQDGGGTGGSMALVIDVAPPPPVLESTIDPTGRFDARTGTATISGTLLCSGGAGAAFVEAQLTQRVGRVSVRGFGFTEVLCDGTARPWSIDIIGDNGAFKGGKAASVTFSTVCGPAFCSGYVAQRAVQLRDERWSRPD